MADALPQLSPQLEASAAAPLSPALLYVRLVYRVGSSRHHAAWPRAPHQEGLHLDICFSLTARHNVLFGASGVGKSTLLRLLAGLLQPSSGAIAVGGRTITDTTAGTAVPAGQRGIGYLTQEPALFPHLSVERNIA